MTEKPKFLTHVPDVTDPIVYAALRKQVEQDLYEDRVNAQKFALLELWEKITFKKFRKK